MFNAQQPLFVSWVEYPLFPGTTCCSYLPTGGGEGCLSQPKKGPIDLPRLGFSPPKRKLAKTSCRVRRRNAYIPEGGSMVGKCLGRHTYVFPGI